jgi:hypothetical protein
MRIKIGKSVTCGSGALALWSRLAATPRGKLEDHFGEAQGKIFLAFSLKSAAGGRSSNLYQGNTYPRIHRSNTPIFQLG